MTGYGASSLDFELQFDVKSEVWQKVFDARSQVLIALLQRFNAEGIEFAYPTQTSFTAAPDGTLIMPYPREEGAHAGGSLAPLWRGCCCLPREARAPRRRATSAPTGPASARLPARSTAAISPSNCGLADWTLDRQPGTREDDISAGDLLVRYGLTDSLEMQVGWTAYTHVRARSGNVVEQGRRHRRRVRRIAPEPARIRTARASRSQSCPTRRCRSGSDGIGAGDWGAGLLVPVSYELPHGFALGLTAEADAAVDQDGNGRHLAYSAILGLDVPVSEKVGATVELSAGRDEDPSGHATQLLAGLSAGWTPNDDLQLDVGANLGLNRDSPDLELYFGVARRFSPQSRARTMIRSSAL